MSDEHEAVILLLSRMQAHGLQWYRGAKIDEVDFFERRISGGFQILDGGEVHTVGRKPRGSLPSKKIIVMPPSGKETDAVLGLWLKWDFEAQPFEFRLFLGQWSEIEGSRTFVAFRFEAPEQGDEHCYYHCQPCRDFGDRDPLPNAALISHRFPTIPVDASNIVELTVCALMASMGHKKMKAFVRKLLTDAAADSNEPLRQAYLRCCA